MKKSSIRHKNMQGGVEAPLCNSKSSKSFTNIVALDHWLAQNHNQATEVWVRIYKKGSGVASVNWNDCVVAALTWGWIDGQKKSIDKTSYLQRMTPRRPRSTWSKRNVELAENLITTGKMQPSGLAQVEAAKENGQWGNAYAGSADMVIPSDFLNALKVNRNAQERFTLLSRTELFEIYLALKTTRSKDTRAKLMTSIINELANEFENNSSKL